VKWEKRIVGERKVPHRAMLDESLGNVQVITQSVASRWWRKRAGESADTSDSYQQRLSGRDDF
jgi:hypothetical protein